jgi:hypothetical protein
MTLEQKLFDIAQKELTRIQSNIIMKFAQGYKVFGTFDIQQQDNLFSVYRQGNHCGDFSSAKVALSYCIAEKTHQFNLGIKIQQLDQHVASARQSVISRKNMLERFQDKPAKEIIYTKIQHRRQQQHELENQLEDCVKQAKYLYLRGLNNETQRISSAAPARSSR